jgi:hypothetical protein
MLVNLQLMRRSRKIAGISQKALFALRAGAMQEVDGEVPKPG